MCHVDLKNLGPEMLEIFTLLGKKPNNWLRFSTVVFKTPKGIGRVSSKATVLKIRNYLTNLAQLELVELELFRTVLNSMNL